MPEIYMSFARKILFPKFGGGGTCPSAPSSPTPMLMLLADII